MKINSNTKVFLALMLAILAAMLIVFLSGCGVRTDNTDEEEPVGNTAHILTEEEMALHDVEDVQNAVGGTNQNDARIIPLDTAVTGLTADGNSTWFAFPADGKSDYTISVSNTGHDKALYTGVYDQLGYEMDMSDLKADTNDQLSVSGLPEGEYYYLLLHTESYETDSVTYSLTVTADSKD